jgi:hypothetical protein
MDVLSRSTGRGDCQCTLRSDGGVSVVGACGCPVHGMKALRAEVESLRRQLEGAVDLTPNESALLEVLAREEVAKHKHPPHDLVRARDKLRAAAGER